MQSTAKSKDVKNVFVHRSAVVDDQVKIGEGTKIWHFSHILSRSMIGEQCNIGQNVVIGPDVTIGRQCKIQNNVSVYKGVTLEDDVFCGPSMVFTNIYNPRAAIRKMDQVRPTLVKRGATIGANATIVCGTTLGRYCFIGAGTVVTRDVPDYALVVGNPSRQIGWVCTCGERLSGNLICPACKQEFRQMGDHIELETTLHSTPRNPMHFIDLASQQARIKQQIDNRIQAVLAHGKYIMGPEVQELEEKLAEYVGVKHAVGCASGTDALLMALMAFEIGPGDAIFTTPFTFIATVEVIRLLGATPVFVDIDPLTFNIDPSKLESAINAVKTGDPSLHPLPDHGARPLSPRGIIAVDLFGLPAEYDRINAIARASDLFVIQDAAQSFGGQYKGQRSCGQGDIGCTSFFPAKPLGCYGDGGMCFTDNDELAVSLSSIRLHGKGTHKYDNMRIGINGRLDTLQAAILNAKFDIFPEEVELRNQAAMRYAELLSSLASYELPITLPRIPAGCQSVWAQYSVLSHDENHRTRVQNALKEVGIPTAIYYPKPLHLQTACASLGYQAGAFPISEDCSNRIFSLPMHPYLTEKDQKYIAEMLNHDR